MTRLLQSIALIALLHDAHAQSFPRREMDPIPPKVDAMYTQGLRFLAKSQSEDGSWPDRNGGEPGVVGLCTLAFLAHGEDPNFGPYAKNIARALSYILENQSSSNGYIGNSMYNHGFATLALAEAYGVVNDPRLAPALSQAVELILSAQERNRFGAWRYTPDSHDADTTVSGCQIVALLAARNAGLPVPDKAIEKALEYMNRCRSNRGGYGYTSASGEKPTLTAIGVTCLALAKQKDDKGFRTSIEYLRENLNYRDRFYPYYFEYYMSQALFHGDEELWTSWNATNIRYLSALQSREGSWPGTKGPYFSTAGALLSLALNYRFLPIYEK
ncbi:MAG: prenyltransferase/squalene oxidase repeat-containing protein [Verrucomicrobiota bacterium]